MHSIHALPSHFWRSISVLPCCLRQAISCLQVTGPKEKQLCAFLFFLIRATCSDRFLVKITAVKVCKLILDYHVMWVHLLIPEPYTVNGALFNDCPSSPSIIHACLFCFLWSCGPTRAMASSFLRFLDHTQRRTTVGRTPLDEWSARRRDHYLTTHNTHNKHSCPRWDSNPRSQQASGRRPTP